MLKKHPALTFFGGCLVLILLIFGIIHHQSFSSIKTASNGTQLELQQADLNQKNYHLVFIYKSGCPDCHKIQHQVLPKLRKEHNLIAFDSLNYESHDFTDFLKTNKVKSVPTIILYHHDRAILQYTGNDPKMFLRVLDHKNPETNHPINTHTFTFIDGFDQ